MNFKLMFLFALIAAPSLALFRDSSEEEYDAEHTCSSYCPNDDAARSCCRDRGFYTGYCKGYEFKRADCEGERDFFDNLRKFFGL